MWLVWKDLSFFPRVSVRQDPFFATVAWQPSCFFSSLPEQQCGSAILIWGWVEPEPRGRCRMAAISAAVALLPPRSTAATAAETFPRPLPPPLPTARPPQDGGDAAPSHTTAPPEAGLQWSGMRCWRAIWLLSRGLPLIFMGSFLKFSNLTSEGGNMQQGPCKCAMQKKNAIAIAKMQVPCNFF